MITKKQLAEIKERAEKATKHWEFERYATLPGKTPCEEVGPYSYAPVWENVDNRVFIFHSRTDIPNLVETLEGAVKVIESLLNSECIKEAPFLSYSEAYAEAREFLKEFGE